MNDRGCRFDGGLSTGPKTAEGKRRSLAALQAGNRAWRARRAALTAQWPRMMEAHQEGSGAVIDSSSVNTRGFQ
jgi:hypothetical protein